MKILSIIGILASLILVVAGFIVSQITCYSPGSYGSNIPDDADTWGLVIVGVGVYFLVYAIITLKRK